MQASTLRKAKMDALKEDKLHRTKRLTNGKSRIHYLLKIIHLNDDCLEEIFFQLDLLDLAKVADANVRLAAVAADVFARKYRNQEIKIKAYGSLDSREKLRRQAFQDAHMIIEHFGKHIAKLDIDCGPFGGASAQPIINRLSEYCSDTLLELKIGQLCDSVRFQKPFVKLEKLTFYRSFCKFYSPMTNIAATFPKIRSIEIQNIRYAFQSIELLQHIPTLDHFGYYTFPYVQFSAEDLQSIRRVVQLNPQLKSLGMYLSERDMANEAMQPVNILKEPMPGIEIFDTYCSFPMANGPFDLANIKHLKLNGIGSLNRGMIEMAHQIQHLELTACPVDEHMTNFILSCRNMKRLEITISEENLNMEHIEHLAKHLPSLCEVHFSVFNHNRVLEQSAITALVQFMRHSPRLARATVAHDIDKEQEIRSRYKHNVYTKSKKNIKQYRDTINKSLTPSSNHWRINHELKPVELVKGFEGIHREEKNGNRPEKPLHVKNVIHNLSSETFSEEELELLNYGLKFAIKPVHDPLVDVVVDIETALKFKSESVKYNIRSDVKQVLKNYKMNDKYSNSHRHSRNGAQEIVKSLQEKDVFYIKADK
ncbi:hypothetical protein Bhyg_07508, partial [Pseudolycoriella hygida]